MFKIEETAAMPQEEIQQRRERTKEIKRLGKDARKYWELRAMAEIECQQDKWDGVKRMKKTKLVML